MGSSSYIGSASDGDKVTEDSFEELIVRTSEFGVEIGIGIWGTVVGVDFGEEVRKPLTETFGEEDLDIIEFKDGKVDTWTGMSRADGAMQ